MPGLEVPSAKELLAVFDGFATELGGRAYFEQELDGVELTKSYTEGLQKKIITFSAERERDPSTGGITDVEYMVDEQVVRTVDGFSAEVLKAMEIETEVLEDDDEFIDAMSTGFFLGAQSLRVEVRDRRIFTYCGGIVEYAAPVLGGELVLDEAIEEDMVEVEHTSTKSGLVVVEFVHPDKVEKKPLSGDADFDAMIAGEFDDSNEHVARRISMMLDIFELIRGEATKPVN